MRLLGHALALFVLVACGAGSPGSRAPDGEIRDVVVLVQGRDEPLPFDARGGRITTVTREIAKLTGHPIVLEIDVALSPELKSSLEETVLASFETIARELSLLKKEDPALFAKASMIQRITLTYDAIGERGHGRGSEATLRDAGKVLAVRSPPDGFPMLERGILTETVRDADVDDLDARWGDLDPAQVPAKDHAAYFAYMTKTRPGYGYLWIHARRQRGTRRDDLRIEHVARMVALANVVDRAAPVARDVRRFLLESASFLGGFGASPPAAGFDADESRVRRTTKSFTGWLDRNLAAFDDEEQLLLQRAVLGRRQGACGRDCSPDAVFPDFDRFGYGLSIYDAWRKDGARVDLPAGPRGELYKAVVCPSKRRGEAETEIRYGCSAFFDLTLRDDGDRARLVDVITKRRDTTLLEQALLNVGYDGGSHAVALVESFREEALFRHGVSVLFHDLARRDDVKSALASAAPRWWRDAPKRRGIALLVMARQWEGLDVHYGDNQWTRFVAEFGGPIGRDVLADYLAEGPRAIEMVPKIWPALAKSRERDALVARHLPLWLDREARSSRSGATLVLLRRRLCDEKNAAGLSEVRDAIERWSRDHRGDAPLVSNALADFAIARCGSPKPELRD